MKGAAGVSPFFCACGGGNKRILLNGKFTLIMLSNC